MSYPKDVFARMYGGAGRSDKGFLYPRKKRKRK